MREHWRDIEGYKGMYQVSDLGRIRSLKYGKKRILKPSLSKGYCSYSLSKDNFVKYFRGHRLVAIAFIPNPENKPEVNHKNGNKLDNRKVNLEWATDEENKQHAWKTGLHTYKESQREKMRITKSVLVVNIHTGIFFSSIEEAAEAHHISLQNLYKQMAGVRNTKYPLIRI
jgi:NUMOD4 motif/HNH endonuclease